jgi:DNA-binding MarR family transcriptional regulator
MTETEHPQPEWRRSATHMLHAALMLKAAIEERLHDATGLFLADNEALLSIDHAEEPLRMSQIAERLALSRAGTTKVIDRLEELGYAARSPDPSDRRATTVTITPAGRTALTDTRPIVDEALHDLWARHLTKTQTTAVLEAADRIMHGNEGWLA